MKSEEGCKSRQRTEVHVYLLQERRYLDKDVPLWDLLQVRSTEQRDVPSATGDS